MMSNVEATRDGEKTGALRPFLIAVLIGMLAGAASATAQAQTFNVAGHVFCKAAPNAPAPPGSPTGWCGFATKEQLLSAWYNHVGEVNREYQGWHLTGFSFHALEPQIHNDMAAWFSTDADGGFVPSLAVLSILSGANANEITMALFEGLGGAWTASTCANPNQTLAAPIVYAPSPGHGTLGNPDDGTPGGLDGTAWAHEIGHVLCLAHTQSFVDPAESSAANNFEDRDDDDEVHVTYCAWLPAVLDTPGDPGPPELVAAGPPNIWETQDPRDGYEYSTWTSQNTVDAGSPHDTFCTPTSRHNQADTVFLTLNPPNPALSMSYFASECKGPYVIGGVRHEAFSADEINRMRQCYEQPGGRGTLIDVCAGQGGDTDADGWCDNADACPKDFNSSVTDTDGDGIPDQCDTCPAIADPTNLDTDADGVGDVCDTNDDNDACTDATDQHPAEAAVPVGPEVGPGCPARQHYASESLDSDNDGVPNCADADDDNDGIDDANDPCPIVPGTECQYVRPMCIPERAIDLSACGFIPCYLTFDWVTRINPPDLRSPVELGRVYPVGDDLFVLPPTGHVATELAHVFEAPSPDARARLWIVSAGIGLSATTTIDLGTYTIDVSPDAALRSARFMRLSPGEALNSLVVAPAWTILPADAPLPDTDGDGVPDGVDRCVRLSDPDQRDRDADGYGDACDLDVNNDGRVDKSDEKLAQECLGAKHASGYMVQEGPAGAVTHVPRRERRLLDAWAHCAMADVDDSGAIEESDVKAIRRARGTVPGPSGLVPSSPEGRTVHRIRPGR